MMNAIKVNHLQKDYGSLKALNDVTFTVRQGEFFGLLGPNGAGKSTLINILAGLTKATQGFAEINGHNVVTDYRAARYALGVVPQEIVQDVFFNVRDLLRIQSGLYGLGKANEAWIDELLDILGLKSKAKTYMRALSGGMKRRVMLAQAMVHKPPVLVLDEPTAGVDIEMRESLWAFIRRLHELGHTVVLTTHYLEEAQELCERIAIINHGELVAYDSKQALMEQHAERSFVILVRADFEQLPATLKPFAKKSTREATIQLELQHGQHHLAEVLEQLHTLKLTVIDIQVKEPSLDEVFKNLTRRPA